MLTLLIDSNETLNEFNLCMEDGSISIIKRINDHEILINYGNEKAIVKVDNEYVQSLRLSICEPTLELKPVSSIKIDNIIWGIF